MLTPLTLLAAANMLQPSAIDAVRCAIAALRQKLVKRLRQVATQILQRRS